MSSGWFSVNWLWCTSFRCSMNYFAFFDWNNQCSLFANSGLNTLLPFSLLLFSEILPSYLNSWSFRYVSVCGVCLHACLCVCPHVCTYLRRHPPQLFPTHVFKDRVSHWIWGEGSLNWQLACQWAPGLCLSQPLQEWDYRSLALCGGSRDPNPGLGAVWQLSYSLACCSSICRP